jgi:uncharacterized membrane protein HdeD (DUF308 family)
MLYLYTYKTSVKAMEVFKLTYSINKSLTNRIYQNRYQKFDDQVSPQDEKVITSVSRDTNRVRGSISGVRNIVTGANRFAQYLDLAEEASKDTNVKNSSLGKLAGFLQKHAKKIGVFSLIAGSSQVVSGFLAVDEGDKKDAKLTIVSGGANMASGIAPFLKNNIAKVLGPVGSGVANLASGINDLSRAEKETTKKEKNLNQASGVLKIAAGSSVLSTVVLSSVLPPIITSGLLVAAGGLSLGGLAIDFQKK